MTQFPASTPVLLLSGAGLPAWIWDQVRAGLPRGVTAVVGRYPRGPGASLADYADAVAAQMPSSGFAVVAHSSGGAVAAELLSRHPGRVAGLLGIAAVVPAAGRSFVGAMPLPARAVLGAVVRIAGTRPPAGTIRGGVAHGLAGSTADRLVAEFDPESRRLFLDRTSDRGLPPVRGYLVTTQDREIVPAVQRRSAEVLDVAWTEEVTTGHLPMLQDPGAVGRAVRRLLTDPPGGSPG